MSARNELARAGRQRIDHDDLRHALEHAAHYLPDQGPMRVFIHHNTLHAFAHLPFHEALAESERVLGARAYLPEARFRELVREGRITQDDLSAALEEVERTQEWPGGPLEAAHTTRHAVRALHLASDLGAETDAGLVGRLEEGGALRRLPSGGGHAARSLVERATPAIEALLREASGTTAARTITGEDDDARARDALGAWLDLPADADALSDALRHDPEALVAARLFAAARRVTAGLEVQDAWVPPAPSGLRGRVAGIDGGAIGERVDPILSRLAAAYLDRGMAYWPMPDRSAGFYVAVRRLVTEGLVPAVASLPGAREEFLAQAEIGATAEDAVLVVLGDAGVTHEELEDFLVGTLRASPGWAGMMSRLERHPEEHDAHGPPPSLVDYLAVLLTLERFAARALAGARLAPGAPLSGLRAALPRAPTRRGDAQLAWPLYKWAALSGVTPDALVARGRAGATAVLEELAFFDGHRVQRVFQEAYERGLRESVVGALRAHRPSAVAARATRRPSAQVVCCIDDREESFRRAIEERAPDVETLGTAGFFGLAMRYRGADEAEAVSLCPVVVTPQHVVEERPHPEDETRHVARTARRLLGARLASALEVGSAALVRGFASSLAFGPLHGLLLVARVLWPGASDAMERRVTELALPTSRTRLASLRSPDHDDDGALGFTVEEKVQRLAASLEGIGLARGAARLVVVLGHGSTSRNNPHSSAYDCGACGGRRGGPSARLFAHTANLPAVRAGLAARGVHVPEDTWFVGGLHDTTSDAITWYDLDEVPASHAADLARTRALLDEARVQNAHERGRRFEALDPNVTFDAALRHAELRSMRLDEPRPECGHATNAVCIVGRRWLTRGLFLDRRAFLVSYDPTADADGAILARTLGAVGPVGAGINLEYYFSFVDNERHGAGTKLPHNVTSLLGVTNGQGGDLRTGLTWQMVEIHEPLRLLLVVEATPERLLEVAAGQPAVLELVKNQWIQLVSMDPVDGRCQRFDGSSFVPMDGPLEELPEVTSSPAWYRARRGFLPPARIVSARVDHT